MAKKSDSGMTAGELNRLEMLERCVIAGALLKPEECWPVAAVEVRPQTFHFPQHAALWMGLQSLAANGGPPDAMLLGLELQRLKLLGKEVQISYLAHVTHNAPPIGDYAGQVRSLLEIAAVREGRKSAQKDPTGPLGDLTIKSLTRAAGEGLVQFHLSITYSGRAAIMKRLDATALSNYRSVHAKALESCVLLPQPCKAAATAWHELLGEALERVQQTEVDPEEAIVPAIREEIARYLDAATEAEEGEVLRDLRRGMAVVIGDMIHIFPPLLIKRIRTNLKDDKPEREHILDAVRALEGIEIRPHLDGDRPRLWAFPDRRKKDAPASPDLFGG